MTRRALVLVIVTGWSLLVAHPAFASIATVQSGNPVTSSASSITPTLSSGTTAGDLLVAVVVDSAANCATDSITAPAGWAQAKSSCMSGNGPIQIWYDPNVASGVTSATFSGAHSGASLVAQLTEWSGVFISSPVDQTGAANVSTPTSSLVATTSGSLAQSGELGVTAFQVPTGRTSLAAGTNWSAITTDTSDGLLSEYELGPASGSALSGTGSVSPSGGYGGVIATFRAATACTGGSLVFIAPATEGFPTVSLNGYSSSSTGSLAMGVADATNSGSGWSVYGTSTTMAAGGFTLPTSATTITSGSSSAAAGNCSLPTNLISYPVTLPAASSPPAAVTLFDAQAGTGSGPASITLGTKVTVPASAHTGNYGSNWTLALASGP